MHLNRLNLFFVESARKEGHEAFRQHLSYITFTAK